MADSSRGSDGFLAESLTPEGQILRWMSWLIVARSILLFILLVLKPPLPLADQARHLQRARLSWMTSSGKACPSLLWWCENGMPAGHGP